MKRKLKEKIILGLKGALIGIANIIPGVSGGTLAITLGIYETLISAVNHFFEDIKGHIKTLAPIIIGAVLAILSVSQLIAYTLDKAPFPTTLFFIGLVIGGVPYLFSKVKKVIFKPSGMITALISFLIVISFLFFSEGNNEISFINMDFRDYASMFFVGIIAAVTIVVPGISGSFILMIMGYYKPILNLIGELIRFENILNNVLVLIPFGIGLVIGVLLVAKIIEYFLKKHNQATYSSIMGIVLASIVLIIVPLFNLTVNLYDIILGLLLLVIGILIAYKLGDRE